MALSRFDHDFFGPFLGPLVSMHDDHHGQGGRSVMRHMALDIVEGDKQYEIKADLPGVEKQDIKLDIQQDMLTLSVDQQSQREETKEEDGVKWHRQERQRAFQTRTVRLPDDADTEHVAAKYEDGVLKVDIPKLDNPHRHRTVNIQ